LTLHLQLNHHENTLLNAKMASFQEVNQQWHSGDEQMHKLLRVPNQDNPTSPYLTPYGNMILTRSPLLALGTLDKADRP
jgi:hypothetical protein